MNNKDIFKQLLERMSHSDTALFVGQVVGEQHININVTSEDAASLLVTYLDASVAQRRADSQRIFPAELDTEQARSLLRRTVQKGWLDADFRPLVSQERAAVLAMVMSSRLRLDPRWKPFERLWGVERLAHLWSKAQLRTSYERVVKDFERGLAD